MPKDKLTYRLLATWLYVLKVSTAAEIQQSFLQMDVQVHNHKKAIPQTIELKVGNTSTGLQMPLLGFGTCCRSSARGSALKKSISAYLKHGGTLIDTAIMYENHADIGDVLQAEFQKGSITRQQLWITSKVAPSHASSAAEAASMLDKSLQDLKVDYVDLFLIHAPGPNSVEIWKGLVEAKAAGKAKAIGVSNFSPEHIQQLESNGLERPSVNQIEFHPWVDQSGFDNVAWSAEHGVVITAYGSLGSSYHDGLEDAKVKAVAQEHGVTPAQVLLRWALHQGVAIVPGATSEEHIVEDLKAGSFDLNADEASLHYFS